MNSEHCRQFWANLSTQCDNRAMMLNADADQIEKFDREEILNSLPDTNDMDIVEVGAGIGRFTTSLAHSARSLLATDIVENFVEVNRRRNAYFKNIKYEVCDALSLTLPEDSADLIFTNWLLMYLSDYEIVQFLKNALRWLRPGGYLHIRESCTHSSSASASTSLHSSEKGNPTYYRYSSVYMKLLRNISYTSERGDLYGFELLWASSISAYIVYLNNWRQIHWLVKKKPIEFTSAIDEKRLLTLLQWEWKQKQDQWEFAATKKSSKQSNKILANVFSIHRLPVNSKILVYSNANQDKQCFIDPQHIANRFNSKLYFVETNEYQYRWLLSEAHRKKDQRVKIFWNKEIQSTIQYWKQRKIFFDAIIYNGTAASVPLNFKDIVNSDGAIIVILNSECVLSQIIQV